MGLPPSHDTSRKGQSCSYKWWMCRWLERSLGQTEKDGRWEALLRWTNENKRKDQQNLPEFSQRAAATPWLNKLKTHTLLVWPLWDQAYKFVLFRHFGASEVMTNVPASARKSSTWFEAPEVWQNRPGRIRHSRPAFWSPVSCVRVTCFEFCYAWLSVWTSQMPPWWQKLRRKERLWEEAVAFGWHDLAAVSSKLKVEETLCGQFNM